MYTLCAYVSGVHTYIFPVSPSVIDTTTTLVAPNELYSITVTCTIHRDSTADLCEVIATANGQTTLTGNSYIRTYSYAYTYVYA